MPALSTIAFARWLLMRRRLLRQGRELRITGLRDRGRAVYPLCRLQR